MDYYDFYNGIKQVVSQSQYNRMLLVKYNKDNVIVSEWYSEIDKTWHERARMAISKENIKRLAEMV